MMSRTLAEIEVDFVAVRKRRAENQAVVDAAKAESRCIDEALESLRAEFFKRVDEDYPGIRPPFPGAA